MRYGSSDDETLDILDKVKGLIHRTFEYADPCEIDLMVDICLLNNGLLWAPKEEPESVIGYFRYYPVLVDVVEQRQMNILSECDLRDGPILHIAALVTPGKGYGITRELIDALNPRAVSCHRYRKDRTFNFRFQLNRRYRDKHASQH